MNVALILSGGRGFRMGGEIPKQYVEIEGRSAVACCMDTFEGHGGIDAIQVVAEESWQEYIGRLAGEKFKGFSRPGVNRQSSILNGLTDILKYADREDTVIIHDAARPFVTEKIISDCLETCAVHDGAMPVLPVKDTMYLRDGEKVSALVDRERLCAGQAPEAFLLGKYYDANKRLWPDKILAVNGSAEAAVLAGMDVVLVQGDEENFKLTTKEDMERFARRASRVRRHER